jgi:integrase
MGVRLLPEQWDKVKQKVIDHPNKVHLNSFIENRRLLIDNTIRDLSISGKLKGLTIIQIKKAILAILDPEVDNSNLFIPRFKTYMNSRKADRTQAIYKATLEHMLKFDAKVKTYGFDEITKEWLRNFDKYLSKTSPSINARNIHFRNIRAVFNAAIDDEITTFYPFRKFKLHDEETRKRNLTRDQMHMLLTLEVKPYQRKYLDCFLLSFYLSGINGVDLLKATKENVVNGRLDYKRSKTGKQMSIKIEPEAQELLDKYKGTTKLVRWGERRKSYKSFMMNVDKTMKEIIPGCTAYYARHTVASLADELDIPEGTIGRILGHKDKAHETTMIYINPLQSKADKACRRIFDYIKEEPEK